MPDTSTKVTCHSCKRTVPLDKDGYLKRHRKTTKGKVCDGTGRHNSFNGPPGDMHEPSGYPFELDWHDQPQHNLD